ncbi:MAG: anhydro-N-acetylmuramic acid kinase [Pseudomonadota bacterium]
MTRENVSGCVIGLISGTSGDGVDAALVSFGESTQVVDAETIAFYATLQGNLKKALTAPEKLTAAEYGALHAKLGLAFGDAARLILDRHPDRTILAVASHGQTLFHAPDDEPAFTLQVGDAARIAQRCGLPVISDFRSADIAAGGQGAPLAPLLHAEVLAKPNESLAVVNLGGIANLTVIEPNTPVRGFDTGPANALMDIWAQKHWRQAYDKNGAIALSGQSNPALLVAMLDDPYFQRVAPKSTGREHFNLEWLEAMLSIGNVEQLSQTEAGRRDIMKTLLELTVATVADAVRDHCRTSDELLLCGGGVSNTAVVDSLTEALPSFRVSSTATRGIDPDFVEAALIAWLGWQRWHEKVVDTRAITGAGRSVRAGSVTLPPNRIDHG